MYTFIGSLQVLYCLLFFRVGADFITLTWGDAGGLELRHKMQDPVIMECPSSNPGHGDRVSVTVSPQLTTNTAQWTE